MERYDFIINFDKVLKTSIVVDNRHHLHHFQYASYETTPFLITIFTVGIPLQGSHQSPSKTICYVLSDRLHGYIFRPISGRLQGIKFIK
jgi:hypothetical protein